MRIHPLNYEIYALDYLEGNMEPEAKAAFEEFLNENPLIEKEIRELQIFHASPDTNETYAQKDKLMKSPTATKASVFRIPSWAVAASWIIAIASFTFWMTDFPPATSTNEIAAVETPVEPREQVEGEIAVVQVDVNRPSSSITEETQTPIQHSPPANTYYEEPQQALAHEKVEEQQTEKVNSFDVEEAQMSNENAEVIASLPQHTKLHQLELYSMTPEVVYYKPLRKLETDNSTKPPELETEQDSRLAIMTPLKRVMRPDEYQKIRDFNLMEDVIMEIDGREVANAFTPEVLKNIR